MDDVRERFRELGLEPEESAVQLAALLRAALLGQAAVLEGADLERFPHEPVDPSRAPS